ncbi:MAG: hypothetical protein ABS913_01485 [Desemzia incerta]|uniref:hypothetical protein n=1 Tax=Desemzia incerta TaxID=82801 RepID=UPI003315CC6A
MEWWVSAISSFTEVIIIKDEYWGQILSLMGTLLGGGFIGNLIAGKKDKKNNEQTFIDQLQEERVYTNSELKERDKKINDLYNLYYKSEDRNRELTNENSSLKWQLEREKVLKEQLQTENDGLKDKIDHLEKRVDELEKERKL